MAFVFGRKVSTVLGFALKRNAELDAFPEAFFFLFPEANILYYKFAQKFE